MITPITHFNPPALQPPSTTLFNPFLFYYNTAAVLRPSVASSLKSADRSIAIAVPPVWNKLMPALRQISDHPTNSPKPCLLLSLLGSFTPNRKHCSSTNPILIHPLLPTSLPSQLQTPSTIAICSVCLPHSLDLTHCLSILFWLSACE